MESSAPPPSLPGLWKLPPLILHPFTGEKGPDHLLEASRAQLAISGLLPGHFEDRDAMTRLILSGRYQELKMLIYIGRDLQRWAQQCLDFVKRQPELQAEGMREESFLMLLVGNPPADFALKLKKWGITDQRSIFSRAIGLKSVFDQPPSMDSLDADFLHSYQRYADYFFICYQTMRKFKTLEEDRFVFELYASEEYARLLADGWRN